MASVKVNLTNEYSSEVFESPNVNVYITSTETLVFDPNLHVAAVNAYNSSYDNNGDYDWIGPMKFFDDSDNEIYEWNADTATYSSWPTPHDNDYDFDK